MRKTTTLAALLAALLWLAWPSVHALAGPVQVHLLVVSSHDRPAVDLQRALIELRARLVEMAGGYTELGPGLGGSRESGGQPEPIHSFLVAASRDLTPELTALAERILHEPRPFILVWPAQTSYPVPAIPGPGAARP